MTPFRIPPCRGILASLAAAAALLASPGPAWSQETATQEQAQPPPIPGASIPDRAEALDVLLSALRGRLRTLAPLGSVPQQIDALEEGISRDRAVLVVRPLDAEPLHVLGDLDMLWARRQEQLEKLGAFLRGRSRAILELRDKLLEARGTWEATRQQVVDRSASPALVGRVDSALSRIGTELALAEEVLAPEIELQERVASLTGEVADVIREIGKARGAMVGRILRPEQEPLWRVLRRLSVPTPSQVAQGAERRWRALKEYAGSQRGALVLQGALFVLLVVLLRSRRIWVIAPDREDPGLRAAAHILARPYAAAGAIALLATPLLHPVASAEFVQIMLVLSIVPVVRLLPLFVSVGYTRRIYALAFVFLLYRIERMMPSGTPGQRILLLIATVGAMVWCYGSGRNVTGAWGPWVRSLARIATIGFAVSILADMMGAVSLATLVSRGTLHTLYTAAICYVAGCALDAFLAIVGSGTPARKLAIVRRHPDRVMVWRRRLVAASILFLWVRITLKTFLIYEPTTGFLAAVLSHEVTFGSLALTPGDVLAFVVAVWIAALASRLTRLVLEEDVLPRFSLPRGVPATISMLARYIILILGIMIALSAAGLQLSSLTIIVGALGVGIGFGLQSLVNNFVSGLVLIFERPVSLGDAVQVGTMTGNVVRIGIRSTVVRTFDGAEVIIPNGNLISGEVINWTLSDRNRRIEVMVGVAYGSDPERVLAVLLEAAKATEKIAKYPAPMALFRGFGESSLDFTLRAWTPEFDDWVSVQSRLALAVHRCLREAGCEIPFPQRDLHVRTAGPIATPTTAAGAARKPES